MKNVRGKCDEGIKVEQVEMKKWIMGNEDKDRESEGNGRKGGEGEIAEIRWNEWRYE